MAQVRRFGGNWFNHLFGFEENFQTIQSKFKVIGTKLRSEETGKEFEVGTFKCSSLQELKDEARTLARGRVSVKHLEIGDVLPLHALEENEGALFQVASQFNCLEFASPDCSPEMGISCYSQDPTQGPACSLAAAAATLFRNYFVPMKDGRIGQTSDNQINNLSDAMNILKTRPSASSEEFFSVRNGYVFSSREKLERLSHQISEIGRERLKAAVRIGMHWNVGVNFSDRFTILQRDQRVSQAFCSAISCSYSGLGCQEWKQMATLVLDAAYEATLWAAVINAEKGHGKGKNKVFLTFLGGGVFGNRDEWIGDAIGKAIRAVENHNIEVNICHYRRIDQNMKALIDRASRL